MKKIIAFAAGLLAAAISLSAQQERDTEWFIGAGGGVNVGFNGKNHDNPDRSMSFEGAGPAIDVYVGKYFKEWIGFRAGWQGLSISDQKTEYGKSKFNYGHADLLFRPVSFFVPYIHAGYAHIDKGSLGLGAGVMFPIHLGKVVAIVPDFKYTGMSGKVFEGSTSKLNHNVSATLGLAFRFGGKKKAAGEGDGNNLAAPDTTSQAPAPVVDTVKVIVRDTVIQVVEVKDTVIQVVKDTVIVELKPVISDEELENKLNENEGGIEIKEIIPNSTELFETGSSKLSGESKETLDAYAEYLEAHPNLKIHIEGHTDNVGKDSFNKWLSLKRADAVKAYLSSKGISKDRIKTIGYGSSRPVASNDTEEGRSQNRRTEILLSK